MRINTMTLAAALSIGLMASAASINAATIEDITSLNLAACPLSGCQKPITPSTATCPSCMKPKTECGCKQKCEPCERTCNPCPEMAQCPEPSEPTCAVCPQPTDKSNLHQQQIYTYPNAIYGGNTIVGEYNNGIITGDANLNANAKGVCVSTCQQNPCGCGETTGAAAPLPCISDPNCPSGVTVDRSPENITGSCCPVQIHTQTSQDVLKRSMVPFDVSTPTGAAVPLVSAFDDVPQGFWAGCDINRLAENNIIAGYPDRTFKPNLPVSRAELATMSIKGFNLNDNMSCPQSHFKDVSKNHWANSSINKAVANGLMSGYPNNTFKPNETVSRAEALTILAKGLKCELDTCQAKEILSNYCDGDNVPSWAQIPVAKALQAGVLTDSPQPNNIMPNKDASRADIASMLQSVRVAVGYDNQDKVSMDSSCGCENTKAYMEKEQIIKVPTLQLCFQDEISAKSANVGDQFAAKTIDEVTIGGQIYPAGSIVRGKVTEVSRPSKNCDGAIKLSFNTIENCKCKTDLPNQILTAQVNSQKKPNWFVRTVQAPFTWTGGILGTASRTLGGAITSLGNATENAFDNLGVGSSELLTGKFRAAGRSYQDMAKTIVKAPIDLGRTALSGTMGLFQYTGDEVAYLVDKNGMRVSSVNPKEQVTISFGCPTQN